LNGGKAACEPPEGGMERKEARTGCGIVVSGPSGAGKGTLIGHLLQCFPDLTVSVSATTRSPRGSEVDGRDYFFLSGEKFTEMAERGEFLEWAEVHGRHRYGTPRRPAEENLAAGRDILFELDVQGAMAIRKALPASTLIFVLPPTVAVLEERLRDRGTDGEEEIGRRLRRAGEEIRLIGEYDYLVINDGLEAAKRDIESIVRSRRLRVGDPEGTIRRFLSGESEREP
jgi:guanylate kinase